MDSISCFASDGVHTSSFNKQINKNNLLLTFKFLKVSNIGKAAICKIRDLLVISIVFLSILAKAKINKLKIKFLICHETHDSARFRVLSHIKYTFEMYKIKLSKRL